MTVPLPASGDGSRRRRREERHRTGRRTAVRVTAIVVLLALVAALGWVIVDLARDRGDGAAAPADDGSSPATDAGPAGLLIMRDGDGAVYAVTMFVPASAAIIHVPPTTLLEVPSLGLATLAEAGVGGDDALLAHSLENALGLPFDEIVSLDPDGLATLLAPVEPLEVEVPAAVEERTAAGRIEVLVPAGTRAISGDDAERLLTVLGSGSPLDRLVRHQAFWTALLARPEAVPPLDAAAALAGEAVQQRILPVEAVAGTVDDAGLYAIVEEQLGPFLARHVPDAPPPADRLRVQVLNGIGVPGVAQRVQPILLEAGGRLVLSGNADRFDHDVTQIVYYDDDRLADARALRAALGVGEVVKSRTRLDVVDVTVVIGADFSATASGG